MPKKNRLTGAEIRSVRSPRRLHGDLFSVTLSPSSSGGARFAFVVSKKVAVRATDRNLIKRRCRAIVQSEIQGARPGAYIFYAKKPTAQATYQELERDLKALLKALHSA